LKDWVAEIFMAARTVNDVHPTPAQQSGITPRQQIHMNCQEIFVQQLISLQMLHRRTQAAI